MLALAKATDTALANPKKQTKQSRNAMGKIHFGLFFGYYILTIKIVVYYVYVCMDPTSWNATHKVTNDVCTFKKKIFY